MSHCLLKDQGIFLFKFLSVILIFFQIKKNLKTNEISKKKKKIKKKFFSAQKFQNSINVSVRQCQCQTMARSN